VRSGDHVNFAELYAATNKALWGHGIVTHSASPRLEFAQAVLFHLEEQAQNNFHGEDKPDYPVAHLSFTTRDVPNKVGLCGAEWNADAPLPYIHAERFKRFGAPPFTPVCLTCCDALGQLDAKAIESKKREALAEAQDCNCAQMRALVRASTFDLPEERGAGDPIPGWHCPVHGKMFDQLAEAQTTHGNVVQDERIAWFAGIAKDGPVALADKDANEWAKAMAEAERWMLARAKEPDTHYVVEYDDLIGVVMVEERKSGRFAALEPALCDSWARHVQGEDRKRVLLAVAFDKFLNNPDVEGK
jgi:hypothetical protein